MKRALSSVLLALAVVGAWSEEPPVHDVVVAVFAAGGQSPLQAFIGNGLVIELSRNQFRATLLEVNAPAPPAEDVRAFAGLARGASTPLAVGAVYSVRGNVMEITLRAVEADGSRLLSTARRAARIDLALDETLISAVQEVVPSMAAIRDRHQSRFPTKPRGAPETALTGQTAQAAGGAGQGAPGAQTPVPGGGDAVTITEPGVEPTRTSGERTRGLGFALGAAPLVPAGDLAVFLSTGISASVHGEVQWRRGESTVGVGLSAGATVFRAEGPLDSADGLLAPLVIEARYASMSAGGTGFYLRGGGGAAAFLVESENEGRLQKIVPCATASLGLMRRLGARAGIALDAAYAVYLDSGDLIMGFAPGLQVLFWR